MSQSHIYYDFFLCCDLISVKIHTHLLNCSTKRNCDAIVKTFLTSVLINVHVYSCTMVTCKGGKDTGLGGKDPGVVPVIYLDLPNPDPHVRSPGLTQILFIHCCLKSWCRFEQPHCGNFFLPQGKGTNVSSPPPRGAADVCPVSFGCSSSHLGACAPLHLGQLRIGLLFCCVDFFISYILKNSI